MTGFLADSWCLHLTFVTICLLSVICKQYLKQYNYSLHRLIRAPDQFPDRFLIISMEFLLLRHRCPSRQNVLNREQWGETGCIHRLVYSCNQLYNFKNYVTKETDTYHWSCHQWQEPFSVWLVLLTLTFDICRIMKTPKGTIGYIEGSRNTANTITKTLQSEAGLHNNKTNF